MPTYRTFQYLEEYIVSSLQYRVYSINLEKAEPRIPGVPLAQWIARWTFNPKVLGSTPRWDDPSFSRSSIEKVSDLVPKFSKVQSRPPPPCVPTHRTTSQAEPQQKTKTCLHIIPGLVPAQKQHVIASSGKEESAEGPLQGHRVLWCNG